MPAVLPARRAKPTPAEQAERTYQVRLWLRETDTFADLHQWFTTKYGDGHAVAPQTVRVYMSRARAEALAEAARHPDDLRMELREILLRIQRDPTARHIDVIKAVEAHAKLYGLNKEYPPVEAVCMQAGCTVEEFYATLGELRRRGGNLAALPAVQGEGVGGGIDVVAGIPEGAGAVCSGGPGANTDTGPGGSAGVVEAATVSNAGEERP